MLKFIRILLLGITVLNIFLLAIPTRSYALFEGSKNQVCNGVNLQANGSCPKGADVTLTHTLSTALNLLSLAVGITAIVMLIIAGIKFITSGGDSAAAGSARSTALYAVIGLIIALLAQIIVHFVLNRINST